MLDLKAARQRKVHCLRLCSCMLVVESDAEKLDNDRPRDVCHVFAVFVSTLSVRKFG